MASAVAEPQLLGSPFLGRGFGRGLPLAGTGYAAGLPLAGLGRALPAGLPFAGAGYGTYARGPYAAPIQATGHAFPASPIPVPTASVRAIPGAATATQFQSGDEWGNRAFGYDNVNSARNEVGSPLGVKGSFANKATGHVTHYIADAAGFRIVPARKKRSAQLLAGPVPQATRPATRFNIQYNPGFAWGYMVL